MNEIKGRIFNILRYATHDGKGIRTLVFLKGCPLSCIWCANPEGMSFKPEIVYSKQFCIKCECCIAVCNKEAISLTEDGIIIDRVVCDACGDCAVECYSGALEINCRYISATEVVDEVERDKKFFDIAEGGVTLSGGEPLAQFDFAKEILKICKARGINTAIETCGCYQFEFIRKAIRYLDFIYFDLKHFDPGKHQEFTGVDNNIIISNLIKLQKYNVDICIRIPIIPTINDDEKTLKSLAALIKDMPIVKCVELLPYHRLGANKYQKIALRYKLDHIKPPDSSEMFKLSTIFKKNGIKCKVN